MKNIHKINENIYITNDEEIKEGDWVYCKTENRVLISNVSYSKLEDRFKIILTTNQDLIKDGVQAIDDEFLKWFVKNPSCEFVEVDSFVKYNPIVYQIILPKPKQETLEEFIESQPYYGTCTYEYKEGIEVGANWQAEKMYSEEDMLDFALFLEIHLPIKPRKTHKQLLEQFKKK